MSLFKQPQGTSAQILVSKARRSCSRTVVIIQSVKKYSFATLQPHKCPYCPLRFCCSFLLSLRQERPHIMALFIFLIWFVISAVYLSLQLRPAIPSDIAGLSPISTSYFALRNCRNYLKTTKNPSFMQNLSIHTVISKA